MFATASPRFRRRHWAEEFFFRARMAIFASSFWSQNSTSTRMRVTMLHAKAVPGLRQAQPEPRSTEYGMPVPVCTGFVADTFIILTRRDPPQVSSQAAGVLRPPIVIAALILDTSSRSALDIAPRRMPSSTSTRSAATITKKQQRQRRLRVRFERPKLTRTS